MAENSKIEWTDHTFNPWKGCTKISPACDHCYAAAWAKRTGQAHLWSGARERTTPANWRKPVLWNTACARANRRARVFCASVADVFDNQVPDAWRADLWNLVRATPHLDWLMLTKPPQNISKMLPAEWGNGWHHVWLGTTVENQQEAERRIPPLQAIPAKLRFLSCEPLLEHIEPDLSGIDWVICGGESGGGARLMQPDWARAQRDQCADAGVAFFMKQMTRKQPIPEDLAVRQSPGNPAAAFERGALLDAIGAVQAA